MSDVKHSALYQGFVQHRRFTPKKNQFRYPVCMVYLDLDETEQVFSLSRLWKLNGSAPVSFQRKDFFDGESNDLKTAILDFTEKESGHRPNGAVRLLANLRCFGYITNPIACYYCFDQNGETETLKGVVAEVTNTPWEDRCWYYIPVDGKEKVQHQFNKAMHVSPFMQMDMKYHWQNNNPGEDLALAIQTYQNDTMNFTASILLNKRPLNRQSMRRFVFRYPFETAKVIVLIYWQAAKLWFKGVPYVPKSAPSNP